MQAIATGKVDATASVKSQSDVTPDNPQSLEAFGLELAIDTAMLDRDGFVSAVRQAAESSGNEFLFDLPASGLTKDCLQIAVLRHIRTGADDMFLIVKLDCDGETITVAEPDEAMEGLAEFAHAFVNLLSRL